MEERNTYLKFESETEEKLIVGWFFRDRSMFLKLAQYLVTKNWEKHTYFNDPKLQFLLNTCYVYSDKYKKMPNEDIIYSFAEKGIPDIVEREKVKKLFQELKNKDYSSYSPEYIQDMAVSFIKKERAVEANYRCMEEIKKGKYDELDKVMRDAINVNLDKDLGISIKDVSQVLPLIQEVHDDKAGCTWGSPKLDMRVGKIQPGEIAALAGVPGAGKTAWLGHIGVSNMTKGKNVILFSFEVNQKRISTRLYKSLFNMGTKEILELKPEKADEVFKEEQVGDFRLVCRPANTCSSNDMAAILRDLDTYYNWKPDLILVDYILITSTNDKSKDSSDTYKYYKTVTEELRNLAAEFNCALVTACQINRAGMGDNGGSKQTLTSKDIAESRGVVDSVDYLLMIEQTGDEKYIQKDSNGNAINGVYRLRVDKNRNGDNAFIVEFNIDWRTMKISEKKDEPQKKLC